MSKLEKYEKVKQYIENEGYTLLTPKEKYKDCKTILELICPNGHNWEVSFGNFKYGLRCAVCKRLKKKEETYRKVKQHIENEGYTLLETNYINNSTPMKIMCPKGHISYISWANFKKDRRCSICYKYRKLTYEEVYAYFEKNGFKLISKEYKNAHSKSEVECSKGHRFFISYAKFYIGRRCPICNLSAGAQQVKNILVKYDIDFELEKKFSDCRDVKVLPFDFYLPKYNCCIEYDGEQHFRVNKNFSLTDKDFDCIERHDNIKNEYCKNNNIKLIRIPYWEFDNIEKIITENLFTEKPSTTIPKGSTL